MQKFLLFFFLLLGFTAIAQEPAVQVQKDSVENIKKNKWGFLSTGYFPLGFFDVDLKTLVKYNHHEGVRLGIGGLTNDKLFEDFKVGGYVAYGFIDERAKYGLEAHLRLNQERKMWLHLQYADDLREIGNYDLLTDSRVYSLFEPRGVNIIQFYRYQQYYTSLTGELTPKMLSELRFSRSHIENIENYFFINDEEFYNKYNLSEVTLSLRYSPKTKFFTTEDGTKEYFDGLPKISAQVTQGIKGVWNSDFNYTKLALKFDYYLKREDLSSTNVILQGQLATGEVPLTHLFHAYPNQPNKLSWTGRFSVAGVQSFETMYFGEFFSDKLAMLQIKHSLRRFRLTDKWKPELVFITRHAIGDLSHRDRHFGIPFNTLDHLYNESGVELNKIAFGFGLSFAYRYGYFHLPAIEENISFKFTFYLKL